MEKLKNLSWRETLSLTLMKNLVKGKMMPAARRKALALRR